MAANTLQFTKYVLSCLRQAGEVNLKFLVPSAYGTPMNVQKRYKSKSKSKSKSKTKSKTETETKPKKKPSKPAMVAVDEAKRFMFAIFKKLGAEKKDACAMTEHLILADRRGFLTHGLARLSKYVADIESGQVDPKGQPKILNETNAVAWVDGGNGMGPVVGKFAMNLAICKAKEMGIGFVTVKGSNHFGICGYYVLMAMENNLFGMCGSNSSPLLLPPCSKQTALGTNPFGFGAASDSVNQFVLDCAMTKVALGKIERQKLLGEKMPNDWAVDSNFKPTTDPVEALKAYALLPAGGYKGYALAATIELLCGVLAGGNYSTHLPSWGKNQGRDCANIAHFFLAIDPCKFAPGSDVRLQDLLNTLRCVPPICDDQPVLVPGDLELKHMKKTRKAGIPYSKELLKILNKIAERLCVDPICVIEPKCF